MKFFVIICILLVIEETMGYPFHLLASSLLLVIILVARQSCAVIVVVVVGDAHAGTLVARNRIFVVYIEGGQCLRIESIGFIISLVTNLNFSR